MKFNFVYEMRWVRGTCELEGQATVLLSDGNLGIFNRQSGENFSVYSGRGTSTGRTNVQSNRATAELASIWTLPRGSSSPLFREETATLSGRQSARTGARWRDGRAFTGQAFNMPGRHDSARGVASSTARDTTFNWRWTRTWLTEAM